MGTWGYGLYQNDTFCEIVETFKGEYYQQIPIHQIISKIRNDFAYDKWEEDIIQLAIAECLWHVDSIDAETITVVEKIILEFPSNHYMEEFGADAHFISGRKKTLLQFYEKIKKRPPKNQIWKKPPTQTVLRKGDCFWYRSTVKYGAIVLEIQAPFSLILLTENLPEGIFGFDAVLDCPIYTIAWFSKEELLSRNRIHFICNLAISKSYTGQYGLSISSSGSIRCTNCGQLATWKHLYRAISFRNQTVRSSRFVPDCYRISSNS